jgi:Flp pilus assembly protein TadG
MSRPGTIRTALARAQSRAGALARRFRAHEDAAAAVEFALVSVLLFLSVFFVLGLSLILFLNQQLDYATMKSARQIMTGYVQKNNLSQTAFRTQVVCGYLPAIFDCNNVIVNVQSAQQAASPGGFYAFVRSDLSGLIVPTLSNSATQYSVGVQGSYEYLQVLYPITFLPSMVSSVLSGGQSFGGLPAYVAMSTTAFRNEQY